MSYRDRLPQKQGSLLLTDGGLETTLVFHQGIDLPAFAAFALLEDEEGTATLRSYYERYLQLAAERGLGFVLESPTWRANPRWAAEIGYSDEQLESMNRRAIDLMVELRDRFEREGAPIVISGCVGPHDDGYDPSERLEPEAAAAFHSAQIGTFAETEADLVTAVTMTYVEEAIGVIEAARAVGMPAAISFTVETDGRLPSGEPLGAAIERTDSETDRFAAYFMINCAPPTHFEAAVGDGDWRQRVLGLRANASTMSHEELDNSEELDDGDPDDLSRRYVRLREQLPELQVLGGCCGTDDRHVRAIRDAWLAAGSAG